MRTDSRIKQDVLDELVWQPNVDETQIGVIVEDGVVTLSGIVNDYSKKVAAERAVKNVYGVKAVADNIEVMYGDDYKKTDQEIAKAIVNAFEWDTAIPEDDIFIKVEDGYVFLSGQVTWSYQKDAAEHAVKSLMGVRYITNDITLEQKVKATDIRGRITKALKRSAELDSKRINVMVDGSTVTLSGTVNSLAEKEDAEHAAYFAPGVYNVNNELRVEYHTEFA